MTMSTAMRRYFARLRLKLTAGGDKLLLWTKRSMSLKEAWENIGGSYSPVGVFCTVSLHLCVTATPMISLGASGPKSSQSEIKK